LAIPLGIVLGDEQDRIRINT